MDERVIFMEIVFLNPATTSGALIIKSVAKHYNQYHKPKEVRKK